MRLDPGVYRAGRFGHGSSFSPAGPSGGRGDPALDKLHSNGASAILRVAAQGAVQTANHPCQEVWRAQTRNLDRRRERSVRAPLVSVDFAVRSAHQPTELMLPSVPSGESPDLPYRSLDSEALHKVF